MISRGPLVAANRSSILDRRRVPFSREEFKRRAPATVLGVDVFMASAEDTILAKLEWAALTDSERQLADVTGMLGVKGAALDGGYIERWAEDLGVLGLWQRLSGRRPIS